MLAHYHNDGEPTAKVHLLRSPGAAHASLPRTGEPLRKATSSTGVQSLSHDKTQEQNTTPKEVSRLVKLPGTVSLTNAPQDPNLFPVQPWLVCGFLLLPGLTQLQQESC